MTSIANRAFASAGLDAFFSPNCVAVVGVSSSGRGLGATTLETLKRFEFDKQLVAINPKMTEIAGVPCYARLQDVPGQVDLALLFTGEGRIKESIEDAAAAGVKAVVIFASGFGEAAGDGIAREQEIIQLAAAHGIRVLGPNCQGIVCLPNRLAATFSNALLADGMAEPAPVAYIGQSGAIGGAVFDLGRERGCVPRIWISTGNQADLDVVELAERVLDDDDIQVLMLYLEDMPHANGWIPLCQRAAAMGKQIVLLRSGTTAAGRRAVASHTGSLVGRDEAFKLVSDLNGVATVRDVNEMVDVAMAFMGGKRAPVGRRLGVVTTSGGAGGLTADLAHGVGLDMATLAPETTAALRHVLSDFATPQNPVDVTADLVVSRPQDIGEVCRIVAADPRVDQVLVIVSAVVGRVATRIAKGIVAASRDSACVLSVAYLSSHDRTVEVRRTFADGGIQVFDSIPAALRVAARIAGDGHDIDDPPLSDSHPNGASESAANVRVVTESSGRDLLTRAGIAVPAGTLVTTREMAMQVADALGDNLVVKLQSPDFVHKSDLGLVVVGASADEVGPLFDDLCNRARAQSPDAQIEGVLVQKRVAGGVELLVDVQMQDNGYPPVLTVAMGGTEVELYADVQTSLLPIDQQSALRMLRRLRGWPLLDGFRGRPVADVDAAVRAIVATADVATALGEDLVEFEINPLIVHEAGQGATVVDFVAYLREGDAQLTTSGDPGRPAVLETEVEATP